MITQYPSEFEKPRRPGDVLVQWRNKQVSSYEKVDLEWHKYKFMSELEATEFIKNCAPNSTFFEYRIVKPLDNNPQS